LIRVSKQLRQTWDLDTFFEGGSASPALARHLDELEQSVAALRQRMSAGRIGDLANDWAELLNALEGVQAALGQAGSFVGCLLAANVKDRKARLLEGRISQVGADMVSLFTLVDAQLLELSDEAFERILADDRIAPIAFPVRERRTNAKRKMDPEKEILATDLSVDGYHAWSSLYDTVVGRMVVPVEIDGKVEELSVGQANNKFYDPDRALRAKVFDKWENAWDRESEVIAGALNHLAGYRLALYKARGWDSFLYEPLAMNRMTEATLNAMWDAVWTAKDKMAQFYNRKARLLGAEKMAWYDLSAPVGTTTSKLSYDEAADFVTEQYGRFSPDMADFARLAFREHWVEAEDRPAKAPGAFCTGFTQSKVSRVFMTFGGDANSVRTLAHELGHAYHSHVMMDLPVMAQDYAMNVAETASTFAEMLINAAAIANAKSKEEKLALLDSKISDSGAYLMNIHARFLFETRFYEARKKGMLGVDQLDDLMETAQKEAYKNSLGVYHPHFWASKLHFYSTGAPFYNFPYTFGYLFSSGIYARAVEEGSKFAQRYVALLQDTGRMTVEELASRHLGVDLTKPDFWLTGVNMALKDVDEFLSLTE
jgi:pepF/M3 family oligoendopeptidase